jgi:hypothetical protein
MNSLYFKIRPLLNMLLYCVMHRVDMVTVHVSQTYLKCPMFMWLHSVIFIGLPQSHVKVSA